MALEISTRFERNIKKIKPMDGGSSFSVRKFYCVENLVNYAKGRFVKRPTRHLAKEFLKKGFFCKKLK